MSESAPLTDSPRVLIVRLSALGDVIHGLPVACALREALPGATIGWVVEGRNGDLIEGHPAIDHVVRAPRGWWKSPLAVWRLRRELRALRFDVAVDLQCLTKSAVAAWLSGAGSSIAAICRPEHVRDVGQAMLTTLTAANMPGRVMATRIAAEGASVARVELVEA